MKYTLLFLPLFLFSCGPVNEPDDNTDKTDTQVDVTSTDTKLVKITDIGNDGQNGYGFTVYKLSVNDSTNLIITSGLKGISVIQIY